MIRKSLILLSPFVIVLAGLLCCGQTKTSSIDPVNTKNTIKNLKTFKDDFDSGLKDFWMTNEFTDSTRYSIVRDPLNPENKVLKIQLKLTDRIANGWRSEIKIKTAIDSMGYKNKLSFKFLLPESFYAKEEKKGRIVIQQWHNRPYPGLDWRSTIKVRPPQALYFEHDEKGNWILILQTGLFVGNIDEVRLGKIDSISPNVWHKFELESFWSLYSDGYFTASLDDNCFIYDGVENCKLDGRNMYHTNPSYMKMGLYRSGSQTNDREIFFDDFEMTTGRIHYFPLEHDEN